VGVAIAPLFFFIIVMSGVGVVVLEDCAQAQPRGGISRPADEASLSLRELGEQLYAGNCASCHGIDGRGLRSPRPGSGEVFGQGPSLRRAGALAADFYLRTGYMPLGDPSDQPTRRPVELREREVRGLVDYVASLGRGPAIPTPHPEAGDLAEGQHLFTEHCAGCHQSVAKGGFVTGARVPPLQEATPTQVAEAVRIGPYLMPRFSKRQISDAELDSIIAYVESTKDPPDRGGWGIGNLGPVPEGMVTWLLAAAALVLMCLVIGERRRS
jgi:ubiquinol-cytochrome c reductase cytochrome c subunit